MKNNLSIFGAALAAFVSCAAPSTVFADEQGKEAVEDLEKAAQDSAKGATSKAAKELDEAEKHLIKENKAHPYAEPMKQISGDAPKAEADRKAFRDLKKAEKDAKKKVAGDAADEAKKALSDVKEKEKAP
ncbi:small metal-binding protein SmbP [Methylococcus mesophilus]|uniref:small metal-binding protein SmbP n=1 Tax=Methylococcus mesophilus TaxID=2993564 RepID=UPI00224AA5CE|nr:small metal-binding protein SmbP [Methylococcus mesophilus]UZR28981.1 small metal-binding protein SmbP [Methylococcus mesophilus]